MVRYLETFYRHRILLIAPIVLALAAAIGFALTQPRMYQASAKVWFDGSASPADYLSASTQYTAPADAEAAVLQEYLQTRTFSHQVGYRGPLASYLAASPDAYNGSLSPATVLSRISRAPSAGLNTPEMDQLLLDTLGKKTTISSVGPQILNIAFAAPDPGVAAATTRAIVDQFFVEVRGSRQGQAKAAVDFYKAQVAAQPKPTDAVSRQRLADLQDKLDQAQLQLAALNQPNAGGFQIIDQPLVPLQATSRRKTELLAGATGLVIGLSISLLVLMALTWSDRTVRDAEDAQAVFGRKLAGTIPLMRER